MQKEYVYYSPSALDFPINDTIEILQETNDNQYTISNSTEQKAIIYAPEVDFYIKNTQDSIAKKIENITKLYDARLTNFDLAQDLDYEQEVGDRVIIVSNEPCGELEEKLTSLGFTPLSLKPEMIENVSGHIGALFVKTTKEADIIDLHTDQIIWYDAPQMATKQSGCVDPNELGLEQAIEILLDKKGTYGYKNFVKYDPSICQYHERNEEICGKCAEVCPTVAIVKEESNRHLLFSHIDCHGCGGCVSVCPSGALDYSQMPRVSFKEIAKLYIDRFAMIIPQKMEIANLEVALNEDVLPLAIIGEKYLHEAHFMTLLQTSGKAVLFYTDFVSKGTGDVIRIINEAFERKYGKRAIFVCQNSDELIEAMQQMQSFDEAKYGINEDGLKKREIFSARLSHLVGNDDLGVVKTGEHVHYGTITINQDNCTLCLSCVGACNVRALTAHPEDNTLRFNPSICTNCGYCEFVCPEKECLSVVKDELHLNRNYFVQNVMAKDELFECVECGKAFATVKSVEKIASMMKPIFGADEFKIRTLYCCDVCKPKVMLKAQIEQK